MIGRVGLLLVTLRATSGFGCSFWGVLWLRGCERLEVMTPFRKLAVLGVVCTAVTALYGQELRDPANLSGERVRASVVEEPIPANKGAAALQQSLIKLRTRASLMMIVAHPDDEDGGMLTYETRGQGVHAATLTLTRGEGGQNLMSADFDDALGLVRTQELLAADRYLGVDQMFGTEVDFGFSKTKEEAFAKWTHERVLYDAVRAVRLFRPLVITSVFEGGPTDGHGQHQVSGEMAQEVFTAAGDPKVFPEMGLEPWSPMKVYARVPFARVSDGKMYDYATNKSIPARFYNYVTKTWSTETPQANVVVHEGEQSTVLGVTYVQFARKGLALQKTQIGEGVRLAPAGAFDVSYHRYGSRVKAAETEQSFFDGIDVTLEGIAALAPGGEQWLRPALKTIDDHAAAAAKTFSMDAPEKCAPELRDGLKSVDALIAKVESSELPKQQKTDVLHELKVKRVQFNDALVQALGLRVEARMMAKGNACPSAVTPACTAYVATRVVNGGKEPVEVTSDFVSPTGVSSGKERTPAPGPATIQPGKTQDSSFEYTWPSKNPVIEEPSSARKDPTTRPYFTRKDIEQAYYDVTDPALRLAPVTPPESFWVRASYGGVPLLLGQVILAPEDKAWDGDRQLAVVPSLSVSIWPSAGIIPLTEKTFTVCVQVRADEQSAQGSVHLALPEGWHSDPQKAEFALRNAGETKMFSFVVTPAGLTEKSYALKAVVETTKGTTSEGFRAVGYKGLTPTNMYSAASYRTQGVDVKVALGLKVAYVPGTGDEVQASLENIGIHATTVTPEEVGAGKLAGYDVVVLGVRAFQTHSGLAAANPKLLEFAKNGGVVIVQYNLGQFDYGPYPLTMGSAEKVVDEAAPVELLKTESPVLNWPNKISEQDFDGWVEERGHGFMESWDPHYEAVLETHDPGQDPQKGGLLVAKTGKGVYIYEGVALYRELPEGVPGAYRLFANLLSVGKKP
jgi:LmbE family N-acetylglucosaminyl deacetylase